MASTTTKVRIGQFLTSGVREAVGILFGPPGGKDSTFNGKSVSDVLAKFRATAPGSQLSYDSGPAGYVYLTTPNLFGLGDFTSDSGLLLLGSNIISWAAAGISLVQTAGVLTPTLLGSDINFGNQPTLVFDNSGAQASLDASALGARLNGLGSFTISVVSSTVASAGPILSFAVPPRFEFSISPNVAGNVVVAWGGSVVSVPVPTADARPHQIDVVATGTNLIIYFDGVIISNTAQPFPTLSVGAVGFLGYGTTQAAGYTGHLASLSVSNAVLSPAQINKNYASNKTRYGG